MSSPQHHSKKRYFYIPWLSHEDDEFFDEGEDSWVSYLRRNVSHGVGEELPFADSSWSYASGDSAFDEEEKKSDEAIREKVLKAFYDDSEIDASHIIVLVLNGVVCLLGSVRSELEVREARKMAQKVSGVWSVRNELEVVLED